MQARPRGGGCLEERPWSTSGVSGEGQEGSSVSADTCPHGLSNKLFWYLVNSNMSLSTHIASSEDQLISGLHFSGSNTASYITDRRSVHSRLRNFKPGGSRLLRFSLADEQGWLVGGTVRLIFKLTKFEWHRVPYTPYRFTCIDVQTTTSDGEWEWCC